MFHVLVTGGAGFIGSHTVDLLLERGYRVRVLDALQPRVHPHGWPQYLPAEVERMQGDVRSRGDLLPALQGIDAVIHLAAYQDYMPDYSTFFHVNTVGAALLYEIIAEQRLPVQKIVLASSQVRGQVRRLLEPLMPTAAVLGYNEVSKGVEIESLGLVQDPGEASPSPGKLQEVTN